MTALLGTNLSAPVKPWDTSDSYPTHESQYGKGGWHEVATIAERDAITSDRLSEGMACYVTAESKLYIRKNNAWVEFVSGITEVNWGDIGGALSNQTDLNQALSSKLTASDIIDNTTSTATNKALSANQGKILRDDLIQEIQDRNDMDNQLADAIDANTNAIKAEKERAEIVEEKGVIFLSELPPKDIFDYGKVIQYTGQTTDEFHHGYFYNYTGDIAVYLTRAVNTGSFTIKSIDEDTFYEKARLIGNHVFVRAASGWTYNDVPCNLSDYGIQLQGTVATGNQFTIAINIIAFDPVRMDVQPHQSIKTINNTSVVGTGNFELATAAQGAKADTALQPSDILDVYTSTATNKALSAARGKDLNERLSNVESRGRFLAVWNCVTGLPTTNPTTEGTYTYRTGDYYIVGTVGETNFKPSGSGYVKNVPSTTPETNEVHENDTYLYDGANWILQTGSTQTVTFASIAGQPTDNTNLSTALSAKQNEITSTNKLLSDLVDDTNQTNKFTTSAEKATWNAKQAALVSGTNIKTINNISLLGSDNLELATAAQGAKADSAVQDLEDLQITVSASEINYLSGVTSNVQTQINSKQPTLTSGTNIKTINNTSLLGSGNIAVQPVITNLSTIESNASAGKSASDTIATYGNIVSHNTSEFASSAQGAKADSALQLSDILDVYTSTATDKALSAARGKDLNDRLSNVESRGRYLSNWDCTTGKPVTNPDTLPYTYRTGDYYVVSNVGTTNYKPTGLTYTGAASTTVETAEIKQNDTYLFDGSNWILQSGSVKTITFESITGNPTDNTALAQALGDKQDELVSGTNIKTINNESILGSGNITTSMITIREW